MITQNEKAILRYLAEAKTSGLDYVTSKSLAQNLSRTDRSVRTYLKQLVESLDPSAGFEIIAKQGFGYRLRVLDEEAYHQFMTEEQIFQVGEAQDINDRLNYLLTHLILEEESLFFDDLVDKLFVSRSTLSADFKKIRELIKPYQLRIASRANKGVYVEGLEHDKRRFIRDHFFSGQFLRYLHHQVSDSMLDLPISLEDLTLLVLTECRRQHLDLSDFIIQNLVIHIALSIKRLSAGFSMTAIDLDGHQYQRELLVAHRILDGVREETQLEFPDEEVNYIALHLIAKSHSQSKKDSQFVEQDLRQDLLQALSLLDQETDCTFSEDFALVEGLLSHLNLLLERLSNHIHLDNPLLSDIQGQYPLALEKAKKLVGHLSSLKSYDLSLDELAYISLHLLASMERFKANHKWRVLVICATGYGSAQMLKHRIKNELSQYVEVIDLVGYYDLTDDKLRGIDMIISSIDLSHLIFTIPVFTVSVFLKEDEVQRIKHFMTQLSGGSSRLVSQKNSRKITDYFDQYFSTSDFMIYDHIDKVDLLEQMVDRLTDHASQSHQKQFLNLIAQREDMSTLIFNKDIAVPHPLKALEPYHKIGLAIVREGLAWEEGYSKVRLVFLVSPSIYDNEGLADLTQVIVTLVDRPDVVEKMVAVRDFKDFRDLFLELGKES